MLHIHCPYCQELRSEEEFSYGGEAHIRRPSAPAALTDRQWGDYLHFRKNPKGLHHELWRHAASCGRYFNVLRDTASHQILESHPLEEKP